MALLTDRASILREFFRLVDTDSSDDDLTEHDASSLEGVYGLLSEAMLEAQDDMLRFGVGEFWLQRSSTTLSFSGSESTDGGRYASLPDDFRRAYGDEDDSALVEADGDRWGQEILPELRHVWGDNYYFRGDGKLWITRKARVPASGLYLEYYRAPTELADGTDADFPAEHRSLIPAHAAVLAIPQAWFPGDQFDEQRLRQNLEARRQRAFSMGRRSRKRRQIRPKAMRGNTHWWG